MTKQLINIGETANDKKGDSLRAAFIKINDNFTDLYTALGLNDDVNLNLGSFEFTGSVMSTTDSSAIVIDQATTITSNLTVGGDILPSTNLGGNIGSPTQQWRSLYVSNNTIFINNIPLSITDQGQLIIDGEIFTGGGGTGDSLVNGDSSFSISSDGTLTLTHPDEPALHPLATVLTIQKAAGNYHTISGAYGLSLQATPVPSGYGLNTNTNFVDIFHDGISVNVNDNTWGFGTDGKLTLPSTNIITAALSQQVGTIITDIEAWNWHNGTGNPYAWNQWNPAFLSLYNIGDSIIGWSFYSDADPSNVVTITARNPDISELTFSGDLGSPPYVAHSPDYVSFHGNPVVIQTQGPQFQADWTFGSDGSLQIPGDITSNGNINIDINLSDSTLRRWQFGEDGDLTFPNGVLKIAGNTISNYVADDDLGSGSQLEVSQSKTVITNGVTTNLGGGGSGITSQALFEVSTDGILSSWQVINTLGEGEPSLTSEYLTELDNTSFKIGQRVTNDLGDGSEPLVVFNGWTFSTDAPGYTKTLTLPNGAVISDTASSPGLLTKKYSGTFVLDPTWFAANAGNLIETSTITGTIQNVDNPFDPYCFEYTGYFVPPTSANYTFKAHADETFIFWIGDKALSGYTFANKDMYGDYNGTGPEQQTQSFTVALAAGQFYPIRIQWGNGGGFGQLDVFTWANDAGQADTADFTGHIYTADTGTAVVSVSDNKSIVLSTDNDTTNNWTFGTDGAITFPDNTVQTTAYTGGNANTGDFTFNEDTITNSDGLILITDRGTLAIGTDMEVPGVAQHFHIAFDGSNSNPPASDLFLGDDNNYVKLPGYELNPTAQFGVEIGTDNRNFGPQNIEVSTVDELVPPGGVWRFFIDPETYPNLGSAVSVGDTVTTSWGTPITATITAVVEDPGLWWIIAVAQDITAGFSGGDTVSFGTPSDSHTWRFGTDGVLTLPNDMTIDASVSFGIVTIGGDNTRISIDNDGAPPGFSVTTNAAVTARTWRFGPDGELTFPDGTIQTTAYTGGSSGTVGTFFVVVNDDGTVSKSTDGVSWTTGADQGAGINRVATNGVTVAMLQSGHISWTTFAGLEASTYLSGNSGTNDEIGGETVDWNQIDYAGGYFVAVGRYTPPGSSFTQGVYGYSTDGRSWTFETVDQTVVEFFGNNPVDSDWQFSDVDYNGVGWMFSVSSASSATPNGGGVYITDLTATVTSARCFSMNITYKAAWNGSAWYMEGEDNIAGVNTSLDPRNGTFDGPIDPWSTSIQDLGIEGGDTVETAGGNGYLAVSDGDGHVAWSDDNGSTWQVTTPIPYTRTISGITQASPAVVTFSGGGPGGDTGEKVIISGSSVSGYNGTFYWENGEGVGLLYTDQALTTPFDTSGLASFTGTATLTWSNGQYIDAMDYINGYFYIGNDDEQIARTTDFVSWTIVDDQTNDFEYWNDIAGFVGTGGTETDRLVNGAQTLVLNANGSVTFPDGSIQTTAYTGGNLNTWVQTFETSLRVADIPAVANSVEYLANGDIVALFVNLKDINLGFDNYNTYTGVARFDKIGRLVWSMNFQGNDEFEQFTDGWGLAVDNADDYIYVAGQVGAFFGGNAATLTKLSQLDGGVEWSKIYDVGYDNSNTVVDVASDGNPIVVGYADNGDDNQVVTTKINGANGTVIWSRALDGQGNEEAYGMAVGPTNEVVTVGWMAQFGITDAAATLYTDPVSNVNWAPPTSIDITGSSGATYTVSFTGGVPTFTNIVDPVGNRTVDQTLDTIVGASFGGETGVDDMIVKVGTLATNDTDDRMLIVKYNSAGSIQWQKSVAVEADYDCTGADADIDSAGNIYVCGNFEQDGDSAMIIIKFNSLGVKQWTRKVEGNCGNFATSIVVGPDDHLYLSAVTDNGTFPNHNYNLVIAKYNLDGIVAWQRLLENTTTSTFGGAWWFTNSGGSNLAVRDGYVAVAGSFGEVAGAGVLLTAALVAQFDTAGTEFEIGDYAFVAATFSGTLNSSASNITVANANKTSSDYASSITPSDFSPAVDLTGDLIGTLYYGDSGSDDRLTNGANNLVLTPAGAVTLPKGGTISEGYVTSNPTIQLTPARPDVVSQKLVIKGGGIGYYVQSNGLSLSWNYTNTNIGDTINFSVYSDTYVGQTLYWWVYPENAGLVDLDHGQVIVPSGGSGGNFSILIDSDDYEFTVRVSPENNNYDPDNVGVESWSFNGEAPTYPEHHLHLTTGNLAETSVFLGTDNHNVRTTLDGGIQVTTQTTTVELPHTITITGADVAAVNLVYTRDPVVVTPTWKSPNINPATDPYIRFLDGQWGIVAPDYDPVTPLYVNTGTIAVPIAQWILNPPLGSIAPFGIYTYLTPDVHVWQFGIDGATTFPTLIVPISDNATPSGTGQTIKFGDSSQQAIIFGPEALSPSSPSAQRVIIQGAPGYTGTAGEGGDVYVWAGPGGSTDGNGGDIKVRAGQGDGTGGGGYLNFQAGDSGTGNGGWINIESGQSNTYGNGGDITVQAHDGGEIFLRTHNSITTQTWTLGADGTTTLPGAVVKSTVAKTGVPDDTGIPVTLSGGMTGLGVADGTYGPFTKGNVTFEVTVSSGGISGYINISSTTSYAVNTTIGQLTSADLGDTPGQSTNVNVDAVDQGVTAIDLTKTINKLTDGYYYLADGVEGQIMYVVRQNGSTAANIFVGVANARWDGSVYSDQPIIPFQIPFTDMVTIIFTDGAWQSSTFGSLT